MVKCEKYEIRKEIPEKISSLKLISLKFFVANTP